MVSWYALNVGRVVGDKITRRFNDPNKKGDRGSSVVYNELMQAWVLYELVQVLHIYGLTPAVRSDLGKCSNSLSKIASYLKDKTKLDKESKEKIDVMIGKLFGETEHSAMFKQMQFGSMSHFKQMTTYAIPFLMITWLRQLEEFFFLKNEQDFFEQGMYSALATKPKGSTTNNNIFMSKNGTKNRQVKVETLDFLKPKMRMNANVCVTLREWAAYIFECEFEPQTLDENSKKILKSPSIKKKKYEMSDDDLDYSVLNKEEEKDTKTAATPMEITKMTDKELFLIVCEALETGGQNTKTKREREHNTEAKRSIVEIVVRKWDWDIDNFKDAMKMLAQPDFTNKQDGDESDSEYLTEISGESESSSSDSSEDEDSTLDDNEDKVEEKDTDDVDEDNRSNNLNNDDVEVAEVVIEAENESKGNETGDNNSESDE